MAPGPRPDMEGFTKEDHQCIFWLWVAQTATGRNERTLGTPAISLDTPIGPGSHKGEVDDE
jgi:hypothetical protein